MKKTSNSILKRFSSLPSNGVIRIIIKLKVDSQEIQELGVDNATAESAQRFISFTQNIGVGGTVKKLGVSDLIALEVTESQYNKIVQEELALHIEEDIAEDMNLNSALPVIDALYMHNEGARGLGKTVVVLDNGFQVNHPHFNGRVLQEACFSSNTSQANSLCPLGVEFDEGPGASSNCSSGSANPCRHGTHVAAIAASSDGTLSGVAPSSNLVTIQVFSYFPSSQRDLSYRSDQIHALNYILNTLRFQFPIAAINMSLGGGNYSSPCDSDLRASVIQNLRNVGIATVIASGNDGFSNAVNAPGCISAAITVGNTRDNDTINFSSNSSDSVDLLAPGTFINAAAPNNQIANLTGTSMAAPMVAGAIASLNSRLSLSVDDVEQILETTGVMLPTVNPSLNKPRIDLRAAFDEVESRVPNTEFVWMRDSWNDTGKEPDPNTAGQRMSRSPDIWIRNQQDGVNNPHQHQNPEYGQVNWAYVKVNNSGKASAEGELKLYFATSNISSVPGWTLLGSKVFDSSSPLPSEHDTIVEFPWTNIPKPGHFCLFAYWKRPGDPADPVVGNNITTAVRNSNKLIWRNVNSVDNVNNSSSIRFARNADGSSHMVIDIRNLTTEELGKLGDLLIRFDVSISDLGQEPTSRYYSHDIGSEGGVIFIPLKAGVYYIPNINIPDEEPTEVKLEFRVNRDIERKAKDLLSISVQNVFDVDAHKQGKHQDSPEVLYILR